ncbi:YlzJ-like family protein [Paenibacillus gansuensis]|uniref:YlzJ-like family protein n=1 Tax=Paenibacillus gansuensis TaxID=306542 RepID=A0ABW5PDZ4_9BACL
MTYYTPMPLEVVFAGFTDEMAPYEELTFQGRLLLVERMDAMRVRVVRLVNCASMEDYLDPKFSPGQVIHYTPVMMV